MKIQKKVIFFFIYFFFGGGGGGGGVRMDVNREVKFLSKFKKKIEGGGVRVGGVGGSG